MHESVNYRTSVGQLWERSRQGERILFRGQRDSRWGLKSGLGRNQKWAQRTHKDREEFQRKLLTEFEALCVRHELLRDDELGNVERVLRFAQHYGLPTTKLDWTSSYYIAIAFAFNLFGAEPLPDVPVRVWSLDCDRFERGAVKWVVETQRTPGDEPDFDRALQIYREHHHSVLIEHHTESINRRLNRQRGAFTECRHERFGLDEYILKSEFKDYFPDGTLVWFDIDTADEHVVIADMEMMGLDPAQLMADLEGVTMTVRKRNWGQF